MAIPDMAQQRLLNQRIAGARFENVCDVVAWLGAVQAQDYGAAKWALALRTTNTTDAVIEQAVAAGDILRTHVLRPTWHFVAPADIRWMLALTAPRVKAAMAYNNRRFGLDDAVFEQGNAALAQALKGKQLTRAEIAAVLERAGIDTAGLRLGHLIMRAELDGILCSGARRGKQLTYALLEERVPPATTRDRDEALAELARRYFMGHGPATLKDYVWWSGLAPAEARAGLEMVRAELNHQVAGGQTYWLGEAVAPIGDIRQDLYLLPNYDEYIVGYTDRSAVFQTHEFVAPDARGNVLFNHTIVVAGQVVGTWRRTFTKGVVRITAAPFRPLTDAESDRLAAAARRYGDFLGMAVML